MAAVVAHDVSAGGTDIATAVSISKAGFVAEALAWTRIGVISVAAFPLTYGIDAIAVHAGIVSAALTAQAAASVVTAFFAGAVGGARSVALIAKAEVAAATLSAGGGAAAAIIDAAAFGCDLRAGVRNAIGDSTLIGRPVGSAHLVSTAFTTDKCFPASIAQVTTLGVR